MAEEVIAASGVTLQIGGDRPFYAPKPDFVQVPPQPAFFDQVNYYRTVLHELTHATGHSSRLGRKLLNAFGSTDYAREELVAEIGSAFLCAALGIAPTVLHSDYIGAWLEVLRADNRAIFRAATAASRAAERLLGRRGEAAAAGEFGLGGGGGGAGMILLPPDLRTALQENQLARRTADRDRMPAPDPVPLLKLFNPIGPARGSQLNSTRTATRFSV